MLPQKCPMLPQKCPMLPQICLFTTLESVEKWGGCGSPKKSLKI